MCKFSSSLASVCQVNIFVKYYYSHNAKEYLVSVDPNIQFISSEYNYIVSAIFEIDIWSPIALELTIITTFNKHDQKHS